MSNTPDEGRPKTGAMVHRARPAAWVALVAATAATCVRDFDWLYAVATALGWFLMIVFLNMALSHQWDACTLCDGPPRRIATPEARARLARRQHTRWLRRAETLLFAGLVFAAVAPKPYLDGPWWVRPIEGAVILAGVTPMMLSAFRAALHLQHNSDCHVERCHAGEKAVRERKRPPRLALRTYLHYAVWQLLIFIPVTCVVGLLALRDDPWGWVYALALCNTGLLLLMAVIHGELACPACIKRLPENGGALAERRLPILRAWHQGRYPTLTLALTLWVFSWACAGHLAGRVLVATAVTLVTTYLLVTRCHSRVKPWCPWCRDGGGEDTKEETPDPADNVPVPA